MKALIVLALTVSLACAEKQLVTISEVSVFEDSPVYFEFAITGPFFEEHKMERLTIRGIPLEWRHDYGSFLDPERVEPSAGPDTLEAAFAYASARLEFYRDGELIHVGAEGRRAIYPTGVCIDSGSGRLRLTFGMWDGEIGIPFEHVVFCFVPGEGIVRTTFAWNESSDRNESGVTTVDCADGETVWKWDKSFHPCRCAGRISGEDFFSARSDIKGTETIQNPISAADFSSLLSRVGRWQPVLERFEGTALDVRRFDSSKFAVVVITYEDQKLFFASSQTIFVRRSGDGYWVRVHVAPELTLFGLAKATIHGFVDEEVLDLTMSGAGWSSGKGLERVRKNLREWWREAQ